MELLTKHQVDDIAWLLSRTSKSSNIGDMPNEAQTEAAVVDDLARNLFKLHP